MILTATRDDNRKQLLMIDNSHSVQTVATALSPSPCSRPDPRRLKAAANSVHLREDCMTLHLDPLKDR